jgi:NhaP-type Na+/H+ or K+/H+ antiporter
MIGWFGIRGIGSVFYLLRLGVDGRIADTLVSPRSWTVAASIVAHGLTAQPLMHSYELWRSRAKGKRRPRGVAPMIESMLLRRALSGMAGPTG